MDFTFKDTMVAKGIAVIFLLIHHLFYSTYYDFEGLIISKRGWVDLAQVCKICVSMFLILSGYGLSLSYKNNAYTTTQFYKHFYIKLYKGFLPISLLSLIPLIFKCNNVSFQSLFGTGIDGYINCLINILGLKYLSGEYGYNPTWWFISLIILLYALFPLLYKSITLYPEITLTMSCYFFIFPNYNHVFRIICKWLFPFIIGIIFAQKDVFKKVRENRYSNKKFDIVVVIIILIIMRLNNVINIWLDTALSILIIVLGWMYFKTQSIMYKILYMLGKHSMNIFLMHTFIFYIYLRDFSYILKYPPLILMQLTIECLIISIALEKVKNYRIKIPKSIKIIKSLKNNKTISN